MNKGKIWEHDITLLIAVKNWEISIVDQITITITIIAIIYHLS